MHLSTLYELFKLNEDASQEEIKESYEKILEEANNLPQNEQTVNQVRRIKIAYGILHRIARIKPIKNTVKFK